MKSMMIAVKYDIILIPSAVNCADSTCTMIILIEQQKESALEMLYFCRALNYLKI